MSAAHARAVRRIIALGAVLCTGLALAGAAGAQHHAHEPARDRSQAQPAQHRADAASPDDAGAAPAARHRHPAAPRRDRAHDHARDHAHDRDAANDDPAAEGAAHGSAGHDAIDHAAMGHGPVDEGDGAIDHDAMDHDGIDHSGMGHDGMDHGAMDHGTGDGDAAPQRPRTPIPPLTDADRAAAFPDVDGHTTHDERIIHHVQFNRLEVWDARHGTGLGWEGRAWIGNDWNRLWLRTEGEREGGRTEGIQREVLYGRPIARWWDGVVGLRHDLGPGPSRTWLALGVMGLAPQWFEIEATLYLGEGGHTAASVEVEYELLLSNRLILQPLLEATVHGKDDPARGLGEGLASAEAGLRLRYEVTRRFAPYIGVVHERAFGDTAALRRAHGEHVEDTRAVAGLRFWF